MPRRDITSKTMHVESKAQMEQGQANHENQTAKQQNHVVTKPYHADNTNAFCSQIISFEFCQIHDTMNSVTTDATTAHPPANGT